MSGDFLALLVDLSKNPMILGGFFWSLLSKIDLIKAPSYRVDLMQNILKSLS